MGLYNNNIVTYKWRKSYSVMMMMMMLLIIIIIIVTVIDLRCFSLFFFLESLLKLKSLNNIQDLFYKLVSFTISTVRSALEILPYLWFLLLLLLTSFIISVEFCHLRSVRTEYLDCIFVAIITIYNSWLFRKTEAVQSLDFNTKK